jgi:OmpA-OmpF porin, OOP family
MKKKLLIALLALAPFAAIAQAVFPPTPPPEIKGPYLGASVGLSNNRNGCPDAISGGGRQCDTTDPALSVFGGYQFNRHFAAEVAYHELGKVRSSGFGNTFTIHAQAFDATALGRVETLERLFAYGRFGVYGANLQPSHNTGLGSKTNYGFTYGLGLQWDVLPQWGARAEWQRWRNVGQNSVFRATTYDVLALGVVLRLR